MVSRLRQSPANEMMPESLMAMPASVPGLLCAAGFGMVFMGCCLHLRHNSVIFAGGVAADRAKFLSKRNLDTAHISPGEICGLG